MRNPPTNSDDIIDSRDVIARIAELKGERAALAEAVEDAQADDTSEVAAKIRDAAADLHLWDEENADELRALKSLAEEGEGSPDWSHGETLIRASYFETYAQELADDIGAIPNNASWPLTCIDWDRAAHELKMDYFTVTFDGVDYLIRS